MAKEIAFHIQVEDAALQQLLKDIGALVAQYHHMAKAQEQTAKTQAPLQKGLKTIQQQAAQTGNSFKTLSEVVGHLGLEEAIPKTAAMAAAQLTLQAATQAGTDSFRTYAESIAQASQQLEGMGETTQNVGQAQEAAMALGHVANALGTIEQISEARLQNELARIKEKRQVEIEAINSSILSEEDKKRRIDEVNAKFDKQTEAKQKAAAKRDKAIAITKTIIAGAQAVAQGIAQFGPPPSPPGIAAIAAAAVTTATQLALIAKQKFAKGGYIPFETGGMIQGATHAQGGVPFSVGGKLMEAEGGELVVNRNIWRRPDFVKNISEMNALTGGRRFFAAGGMVPTVSPPAYVSTATIPAESFDNELLVRGLRGVIAEEVGSLKVVNNVVDTTSQQQRLLNIQTQVSF